MQSQGKDIHPFSVIMIQWMQKKKPLPSFESTQRKINKCFNLVLILNIFFPPGDVVKQRLVSIKQQYSCLLKRFQFLSCKIYSTLIWHKWFLADELLKYNFFSSISGLVHKLLHDFASLVYHYVRVAGWIQGEMCSSLQTQHLCYSKGEHSLHPPR